MATQDVHELPSTLVEEANRFIANAVPRITDMDIRVIELRPDRMSTYAPLGSNGNHFGSMYAGTLFGMAELMGGIILFPSVDFSAFLPTVKDLQIRYRRPARSDITAVATLDPETLARIRDEARERGRSEYRVDATLTDTSGNVVATTQGTYQLLAVPPSQAQPGVGRPDGPCSQPVTGQVARIGPGGQV